MWMELELKTAVQALSQIWPMERREPEASLGKAWDFVVLGSIFGSGKCAVAVDVMMLPLGTVTWTAGLIGSGDWKMGQFVGHLMKMSSGTAVDLKINEWRGGH